jgi:hypothetical protein
LMGYALNRHQHDRARRTSECGKLRERASAPNCSASAVLTITAALSLPMEHHNTHRAPELNKLFMGHDTRVIGRAERPNSSGGQ